MKKPLKVLIVEDSESDTELTVRELRRGGYDPVFRRVETVEAMSAALDEESWDVVISDHAMPRFGSKGALHLLQRRELDLPFIVISGSIGESAAVAMMKAGASDYVMKEDLLRLVPAVERELREAAGRREQRKAEAALRRSQAQLHRLVDSNILGVIVADTDGQITEANDAFLRMVGFSREELAAGQVRWDRLTPPEWREADQRIVRQVREHGAAPPVETEYFHKDGSRVPILIGAAAWEQTGETIKCVCFILDLTERKRLEKERNRLIEDRLLLLECVGEGIYGIDLEARCTFINSAAAQMLGYTADELLGKNIHNLIHHHRADGTEYPVEECPIVRAFREQRGCRVDHEVFWRRDGAAFPAEYSSYPVREGERTIGAVVTLVDISERKRVEGALREQARLLDLAQDAIVVCDLEQRVLFWNNGAERLYGWTANEAHGRPITELIYRDPAPFEAACRDLFQKGEWSGELQQVTKANLNVVVNSRWNLVADEQGHPKSIFVINTDLTERKSLETQFLHAQRLESIGTLAGGIAHDLNNVLAPILMATHLLRDGRLDAESAKIVDTIRSSAQRGAGIVQQVLAFARRVGGAKVVLQPGLLVNEVTALLHQTLPKSIAIACRASRDLWTVQGDPTQLHQVLLNLCVNARDAMPHGGRLEVTAEDALVDENFASMTPGARVGPHVLLRVTDTGIGIPRAMLTKIFDPFFTTKEVGKGTGLGLSTVLGIVKSHGGFITVNSEPGKGSTFNVYLPATPSVADQAGASEVPAPAEGRGEVVLVVDDEEGVREVTRRVLEKHGYQAVTASDGVEALAVFAQNPYGIKVVLTDVVMPNLDGIALIQVLRRINPRLRIIVSSGAASGMQEDSRGAELQALKDKTMLSKPYTAKALLDALQKTLDRADAGEDGGG